MTAAKDGVLVRRRLRIFAAAAALVLLCAVCVGGVSGADLYVGNTASTESNWYTSLADAVDAAGSGDTIIITEDYVIKEQVVLERENVGSWWPIYAEKDITITNAPGVDVVLSSGLGEIPNGTSWDQVDPFTLFMVEGGSITIEGNPAGGSITFTTNHNGRIFDIQNDASVIMNSGAHIKDSGYDGDTAAANNGGAVYVRNGEFIMNGGSLTGNTAGAGGAVYVEGGSVFTMHGGQITGNTALNKPYREGQWGGYNGYGGGVWGAAQNCLELYGGFITGNASPKPDDPDLNYNQIYYPGYREETSGDEEVEPPLVAGYISLESEGRATKYQTILDAYDKAADTDTIYIEADSYQAQFNSWEDGGTAEDFVPIPELVTVTKQITIKPYGESVSLKIDETMFSIEKEEEANGKTGSLTLSGNGPYSLSVLPSESHDGSSEKGFVLVNGGSFTLQTGATLSSLKAENGGAVYVNSGTCTLAGGSITGCSASVHGDAVYVHDGTLIVDNSFTLPATNDIYLADNQVITVASGYSGSIGKITLSNYDDGRNVVNVTAYSSISASKFILNDEAHEEVEKTLVLTTEGSKKFLEIQSQIQFTIIIPEDLELSTTTYDGIMTVSAKNVKIPQNAWISVTVQSQYDFNLTHARDSSILLPYALTLGSSTTALENNAEIARFTMANSPGSVNMQAKVTVEPQYSGSYADYLTFTIQYGTA